MDTQEAQAKLEQFGQHYHYDVAYLIQLLRDAPEAFEAFSSVQAMASYRKAMPLDACFVAKLSVMKSDDCGACANLCMKMAAEQGVDRQLLKEVVLSPETLPHPLKDIHDHVVAVVKNQDIDAERIERIRQHYGAGALAELAVTIAGNRIYPTLKRALGNEKCERLNLDS